MFKKLLLTSLILLAGHAYGAASNTTYLHGQAVKNNGAVITFPTSTATFATLALNETLTNKILTGNTAANFLNGGFTVTLPAFTSTLATLAGTETLTNKTLSGNTATNFLSGGFTVTLPTFTSTLATLAGTETLTNKTLTGNIMASFVSGGNTITAPTSTSTLATLGLDETLTGVKTFEAPLTLQHETTPANPSAGYAKAYVKSDNKLYVLTSGGVETAASSGKFFSLVIGGDGSASVACTSDPCTASNTESNGVTIGTVNRAGAGQYSVNITGCSAKPKCEVNGDPNFSGNQATQNYQTSTSSVAEIVMLTAAGSGADGVSIVDCKCN